MKTLKNENGKSTKLNFIGFHETKRNLWNGYRRFSLCGKFQRRCNENTVYYSLGAVYNH